MVLLEIVCLEQLVTYEMLYCIITLYVLALGGVQVTVILVLVTVLTDTSLTCTGTKWNNNIIAVIYT